MVRLMNKSSASPPAGTAEVIVRLKGGIGNQLFEYAAARAVALRNNAVLKLDAISGFAYDFQYNRSLKLDQFAIKATYANRHESYSDRLGRPRRALVRALNRFRPLPSKRYISDAESDLTQHLRTTKFQGKIYLDGLWQNEDYFADCIDEIRADLSFVDDLPSEVSGVHAEIASSESVGVHVRRLFIPPGEKKPIPLEDHIPYPWLTRKPYYDAAIASLCSEVENPHFFIFSDYPDWARKNLFFPGKVTYIAERPGDHQDVVDLRLMSQCRHHIISASTYSWWGAWLSGRSAGRVFAPREGWPFSQMPLPSWRVL